jgi:hypothetical protein
MNTCLGTRWERARIAADGFLTAASGEVEKRVAAGKAGDEQNAVPQRYGHRSIDG